MRAMGNPIAIALPIVLALAVSSGARQPAFPPAPKPFDVNDIVVERSPQGTDEDVSGTPLVTSGAWPYYTDMAAPRLIFAAAIDDFTPPGVHSIVGYLGGVYPAEGDLVAERYERNGNEISLAFRYVKVKPPEHPPENGWSIYFYAQLPADLPDGNYKVTATIRDLPAVTTGRPKYEMTFAKPDAKSKYFEQRLKALQRAPLDQWVDQYRAAADEEEGGCAPHEAKVQSGLLVLHSMMIDQLLFNVIKHNIIARGTEITPYLLEGLSQECDRNPEPEDGRAPRGISRELILMLEQIGDARAAPLLVEIIGGKRNCNSFVRTAALETLERLTYVRFRRKSGDATLSVCGPEAVEPPDFRQPDETKAFIETIAPQYAKWLAEYPAAGADRSLWLKAARSRARSLLESDDLDEALYAAQFLRYHERVPDRGRDAAGTTARIAAILERCELRYNPSPAFCLRTTGKPIPHDPHSWMEVLTSAGPIPERYAALLIRSDDVSHTTGRQPGRFAHNLCNVGGREAMAYRIKSYAQLLEAAAKHEGDPQRHWHTDENAPRNPLASEVQWTRFGIERWAGRTFATDAEITAWWHKDKDKTQRQWLEEGLPILATQADAGHGRSQHLLQEILERQLPTEWIYGTWNPPSSYSSYTRPEEGPPYRVKWVAEHRDQLQYDPDRGMFRLPKPSNKSK